MGLQVVRHRRGVAAALATWMVACGGATGAAGGGDPADPASYPRGGLVGNPAPNFSARAVGSVETVSLRKLHGQVVLIDFWGTFCEPCRKSFPKLQALSERFSGQGFRVVGISEDEADDRGKIPGFADSLGARFTLAWDADRSIARAYGPETMPTSLLIDRRGIVRYVHVGYYDGEDVELAREIQGLLAK
jgi:cytochrome c biogenesis protein CcmG, thiol:disulfide interchange protein DsbE